MWMGYLYQQGIKDEKDAAAKNRIESNKWFLLAMTGDDSKVRKSSGDESKKLEKEMSAADIAESKRRARLWKPAG